MSKKKKDITVDAESVEEKLRPRVWDHYRSIPLGVRVIAQRGEVLVRGPRGGIDVVLDGPFTEVVE
ncbi:hypothetical protein SEA_BEXAN_37 [Mycobacterium phage Bexan]|nr:hypothetical protein PAPHU_38 [Mycobacterium phage Paphu]QWS69235.1 hypothetical protein SEA_BEXAN_37 [Mycobacterium phage Bexan]